MTVDLSESTSSSCGALERIRRTTHAFPRRVGTEARRFERFDVALRAGDARSSASADFAGKVSKCFHYWCILKIKTTDQTISVMKKICTILNIQV